MEPGLMLVRVAQGWKLVGKDGPPDSFCEVSIVDKSGKKRETKKSHTIRKESNPVWDAFFVFDMSTDTDFVEIYIYDRDSMILDELIGYAKIPMNKIYAEAPFTDRLKLSIPEKSLIPLNIPVIHPQKFLESDCELVVAFDLIDSEQRFNIEEQEKLKCDIRKRKKELYRLFNVDDNYIKDFSCALEKNILHWGRVFVTDDYLLFNSPFKKKVISISDIKTIERCKMAKMFNTGVTIVSENKKKVTFKSFKHRSEFIDLVTQLTKQKGKEIQIVDRDDLGGSFDEDLCKSFDSDLESSTPETQKSSLKWKRPFKSFVNIKNKLFNSSSSDIHGLGMGEKHESSESDDSDERIKEQAVSKKLKNSLLMGDVPLVSGEEEDEEPSKNTEKSDSTLAYTAEEQFSAPDPTKSYRQEVLKLEIPKTEVRSKTSRRKSTRRKRRSKEVSKSQLKCADSLKSVHIPLTSWTLKAFVLNFSLTLLSTFLIYREEKFSIYCFTTITTILTLLFQFLGFYLITKRGTQSQDARSLLNKSFYTWKPFKTTVIVQLLIIYCASKATYYISLLLSSGYPWDIVPIHEYALTSYYKICMLVSYIFTTSFTCYVLAEGLGYPLSVTE